MSVVVLVVVCSVWPLGSQVPGPQLSQLLPLKTPDRIASAQFQEGSNFNYEGT